MQACCAQGVQISGLVPLRQLAAWQLVQPGWLAAAAAQLYTRQQPQRRCAARAASSLSPAASADAPSKPLFSSRAKIAETCVPWLKGSRNRWAQQQRTCRAPAAATDTTATVMQCTISQHHFTPPCMRSTEAHSTSWCCIAAARRPTPQQHTLTTLWLALRTLPCLGNPP